MQFVEELIEGGAPRDPEAELFEVAQVDLARAEFGEQPGVEQQVQPVLEESEPLGPNQAEC